MRTLFLFLIVTSVAFGFEPSSKEEDAKRAAEVVGATYAPTKPDEPLIDFSDASMNDEEKEVILANYERTRHEYKEDSTDSLFERISKAYVRNLDKILVKKKAE